MWDATMTAVEPEWQPVLDVPEPGPQSRLTVLFRLLLAIPQLIVVWVLGLASFVLAVIGWFGALFSGHLPAFAVRYLSAFLAYDTRVAGYLMLLVDRYPPFQLFEVEHPVRIDLRPGPLNRLAVFFRLILAFPAAVVQGVALAGWGVAAFFCWLAVLIAGRCQRPLFEATAAVLRYRMRFQAYLLMLTSAYPKRLFGDAAEVVAVPPTAPGVPPVPPAPPAPPASATRPLRLSTGGRVLLIVFLVLGLASDIGGSIGGNSGNNDNMNSPGVVQVSGQLSSH